MTPAFRLACAFALLTVTATACRRQPAAEPAPEPVPIATVDSTVIRDSVALERDRLERERIARERDMQERERAMAEARNALAAVVYFDYDRADLSEDARATLEAKVPVLQANPSIRLRVAGHTDARGSDEYNMALAQRRAAAVQRYLADRGVDASRLEIVSFGEERPAVAGENESAWAQNRRAEFEVIAGVVQAGARL